MGKILCCLGLSLTLAAFTATAQEIKLKTEIFDSAPKYMKADDGNLSGFCIDLMKLIEKKSNFRFTYENKFIPLKRVETDAFSGDIDVFFGVSETPDRKANLTMVGPLYPVNGVLVARIDDDVKVNSLDDLKKIAAKDVILSYSGNFLTDYAKKDLGIKVDDAIGNFPGNLNKLLANRGRLFLATSYISYELNKPEYKGKLKVLPFIVKVDQQWLGFSKKVPKEQVEKMSEVIQKLRKEKEWNQILAPYLGS